VAEAVELEWQEALPGDFNLDGACDFDDLVQLSNYNGCDKRTFGLRQGTVAQHFDILDANADGSIGLGDIRPLAQHYMQRLDSYEVQRRQVGSGKWSALPETAERETAVAASLRGGKLEQPPTYNFSDSQPLRPTAEYRVVARLGAQRGTDSWPSPLYTDTARSATMRWHPPAAVLRVGQPFSPELNGGIIQGYKRYRLDVGADGSNEGFVSTFPSDEGQAAALEFTPQAAGELLVRIAYEDSVGNRRFEQTLFNVTVGNRLPALPPPLNLGDSTVPRRLAVDEDSCRDPDGDQLEFSYELTFPDNTIVTQRRVPSFPALEVPGRYNLRITASDSMGSTVWTSVFDLHAPSPVTDWQSHAVPLPASPYSAFDAAIIGGRLAIAYVGSERLMYSQATDEHGTQWPTQHVVLESNVPLWGLGLNSAKVRLLDTGGRPGLHLAAKDMNSLSVTQLHAPHYFIAAQDDGGAAWLPPHPLAGTTSETAGARWGAMALVDNRPALAYLDGSRIAYLRALDTHGTDWPAVPNLIETRTDFPATDGLYFESIDLVEDDRLPLLALGWNGLQGLYVCAGRNVAGGAWSVPRQVTDREYAATNPCCFTGPAGQPVLTIAGSTFRTLLGSEGAAPTQMFPVSSLMQFSAIERDYGTIGPHIAVVGFVEGRNGLFYCESLDRYGTGWGTPSSVSFADVALADPVLLDFGGQPGILYWQLAGDTLQLMLALRSGSSGGA
jgi:hypothetical protein